jgi:hypothetical protein
VWNEQTSTSPSLRHLGHYKCLLVPDGNDKAYTDDNPNPAEAIMLVYYQVAMAALKSGNALERWTHVTTTMIEKIPGLPRIHKLRVIHLYEADYNLLLNLLWSRQLVWNAHNAGRLNASQGGCAPGRQAVHVVIDKEMKYLFSRLTRTDMATLDNDAKSCFDRIIVALAMIISRYFGMTKLACKMQAKTLQNMQFRIRTALGDSQ